MLQKLVADALLVPPLLAQLVHKNNVVALAYGKLRGARGEGHPADDEVLGAVGDGRLGAEFIALHASIVKQLHHAVGGDTGESLGVGAPVEGLGFRV